MSVIIHRTEVPAIYGGYTHLTPYPWVELLNFSTIVPKWQGSLTYGMLKVFRVAENFNIHDTFTEIRNKRVGPGAIAPGPTIKCLLPHAKAYMEK